jgi:copper homeostasis protein (lipoprotein)
MADAGLFTDCATGVRVPVAMEADNAALERAYLGAREEAGAQLLVSLMGRLEERPRTDGEGTRDFLVVTRFEQVWPAETCEKSTLSTPLENTRWKLVELGGARVQTHADQPQEVHLRFLPDEKRVAGFAGCNNVMGSYELSADGLKFGLLATTMMACPHLDEEVAFTSFLEGVGQFLILGESLVLSAESGDVARFTAVHVE